MILKGGWFDQRTIHGKQYICGYCGSKTSSKGGYECGEDAYGRIFRTTGYILICITCNQPTYLMEDYGIQVPSPNSTERVNNLPDELTKLFEETRKAFSNGLFTATVLMCRKLLMNIAVTQGAEKDKTFAYYVNYLVDNQFITPMMKPWVDKIRTLGNTATHEIPDISQEDATLTFKFLVMLLRIIYEFPAEMGS